MSIARDLPVPLDSEGAISRPVIVLFATAVGIIVTNLFAPQTLVGLMAPALGLPASGGGLIAMATLLGYAAGLFLLVPLADLAENRRLILRMLGCATICAAAAALAPGAGLLLAALFLLGAACSAIQILVPIAASMAAPAARGAVIGDVMSGLMIGILLSRPLASGLAEAFGWRAFYVASALSMAILVLVLALRLPRRTPAMRASYGSLIASLWHLLRAEPVLRRRALSASLVMAAFSLFWTAVALRLALPPFGLDQRGIALFALVGAGGAVITPLAGRAGDRGFTRPATIASHIAILVAFAVAAWAGSTSSLPPLATLALLGAGAVLLDVGVTGDQTLGRRAVNLLQGEARGRLNALFVGIFFLGGALGSALAGLAWAGGGWTMVCATGALFGLLALILAVFGGRD